MSLSDLVLPVFAPDGPLARVRPHLRSRPGQAAMALAVAQAINARESLVVEAGTGIGKTFAYLVPALLSGERVLISTATKTLQDQLLKRDLPLLQQALALPLRVAALKGRANYLCLYRLEQARRNGEGHDEAVAHDLACVERWAQSTRSGDLAEVPGLDEYSAAWRQVTSTVDNCLGSGCPRLRQCHVYRARHDAQAADVLIINHHLFFADLGAQGAGAAQLLPDTGVVVFDEAHRLAETAAQFLGTHVSTSQLLQLGQDVVAAGARHARGAADWQGLLQHLRQCAHALRLAVAPGEDADAAGSRIAWTGVTPEALDASAWDGALEGAVAALRAVLAALDGVAQHAPDLAHLHSRTVALLERVLHFCSDAEAGTVRWVESAGALRMVETPLDVAGALRTLWEGKPPTEGAWDESDEPPAASAPRSWIYTSATLGDGKDLRWFTDACGLEGARTLQVPSPFDYVRQAALYVPSALPLPSDAGHSVQLARWVGDAVARLGGHTLVLTTSLRALAVIADELCRRFAPGGGIEVLVQGHASRSRMVERFRAQLDASGRPAGHVLVGAASFWEGIDVPGEALQMVVIDKLPFPAPGDPWEQAQARRLADQGGNVFRRHALPSAAVALKQGAGRLIRNESDHGILVIADTRLLHKGYGKPLLRALPPMRRLHTQEEFGAALDALTRTSTRGSPSP
ncbi:ATP-dependent DNA helicase [Diaphorobacter sp.]|uniref:ATP-dependent DNA helicase n=1 Tax=Diaphorobacter sp. TaxID=1934310 RepID=UPI002589C616|nr:ATP-dependent DNA helicase [Diaphorobacter sp.]